MRYHIERHPDSDKTMCGLPIVDGRCGIIGPAVDESELTEIDGFNVCQNCNWIAKHYAKKESDSVTGAGE